MNKIDLKLFRLLSDASQVTNEGCLYALYGVGKDY